MLAIGEGRAAGNDSTLSGSSRNVGNPGLELDSRFAGNRQHQSCCRARISLDDAALDALEDEANVTSIIELSERVFDAMCFSTLLCSLSCACFMAESSPFVSLRSTRSAASARERSSSHLNGDSFASPALLVSTGDELSDSSDVPSDGWLNRLPLACLPSWTVLKMDETEG